MTSCLHTRLRDQTPCSSLSKKCFREFRLILTFENGFEEKKGALRKEIVRLVQLFKENGSPSMNHFAFEFLIKKIKEKIQWSFDSKDY